MEQREIIALAVGRWTGLYRFGSGWEIDKLLQWQQYWQGAKGIFWKVFIREEYGSPAVYLVSNSGSAVLYPTGFTTILRSGGVSNGNGKYLDCELEELHDICQKCAEYCGVEFSFAVSDEYKCEFILEHKEYGKR